MFRSLIVFVVAVSFCTNVFALNLSRVKTWTTEVLTASDLNAEFDNIINHSIANADISASAAISGSKLDLSVMSAVGGSSPAAGTFTTLAATSTLAVTGTSTLTGNVGIGTVAAGSALTVVGTATATTFSGGGALPSGAVFFMATGSCPSWTTDISATYPNKYIKINSTALTSQGVILTGTTDAHTLTQAELPNVSFSLQVDGATVGTKSAGGDGPNFGSSANGGNSHTATAISGGSGTSFTHTISSATTLEPSSITMKACQVT